MIYVYSIYTYFFVDGRPAIHIANSDIIKLAKSVSKCAASVAMAKLFDTTPPLKEKKTIFEKHDTRSDVCKIPIYNLYYESYSYLTHNFNNHKCYT